MGFEPETKEKVQAVFTFEEAIQLMQVGASNFNFLNNNGDICRVESTEYSNYREIMTLKLRSEQ